MFFKKTEAKKGEERLPGVSDAIGLETAQRRIEEAKAAKEAARKAEREARAALRAAEKEAAEAALRAEEERKLEEARLAEEEIERARLKIERSEESLRLSEEAKLRVAEEEKELARRLKQEKAEAEAKKAAEEARIEEERLRAEAEIENAKRSIEEAEEKVRISEEIKRKQAQTKRSAARKTRKKASETPETDAESDAESVDEVVRLSETAAVPCEDEGASEGGKTKRRSRKKKTSEASAAPEPSEPEQEPEQKAKRLVFSKKAAIAAIATAAAFLIAVGVMFNLNRPTEVKANPTETTRVELVETAVKPSTPSSRPSVFLRTTEEKEEEEEEEVLLEPVESFTSSFVINSPLKITPDPELISESALRAAAIPAYFLPDDFDPYADMLPEHEDRTPIIFDAETGEETNAEESAEIDAVVAASAEEYKEIPRSESEYDTEMEKILAAYIKSVRNNKNVSDKEVGLIAHYTVYYARKYNLPLSLVVGVMQTESNFRPSAVSSADARGLMQVMWRYHGTRLKKVGLKDKHDLHDIKKGIESGCIVLAGYIDAEKNVTGALGRYYGALTQQYVSTVKSYKETFDLVSTGMLSEDEWSRSVARTRSAWNNLFARKSTSTSRMRSGADSASGAKPAPKSTSTRVSSSRTPSVVREPEPEPKAQQPRSTVVYGGGNSFTITRSDGSKKTWTDKDKR